MISLSPIFLAKRRGLYEKKHAQKHGKEKKEETKKQRK
jgi:hypothetical protein